VVTDDTSEPEQVSDLIAESEGEPLDARRRWSAVLITIATVLAVTSVFSTWVRVQALETDQWVSLSDELLDEPRVQEALSSYLVAELFTQLDDVQAEIENWLPEDLRGLAGPVTAALRGPAATAVEGLIGSERFRVAWLTANRVAHENLVSLLREESGPVVSTANGAVTLDLGELLRVVGRDLGLSATVLDRLPADAGMVTIFESDQLDKVQTAVAVLDFLSWFLTVVVAALYAAAVYLARGRRLIVLRNVGLSLMAGGVFVLAVRAIAIRLVLDAIVANPGNRPLANVTTYVATGLMRQMAWSGIVYGVLIAGFASLLGARRWATASRRVLAPLLNGSPGAVAGGTVGFVVLLLWWSPGRAFQEWTMGLLVITLVVVAVVALRRATLREYPDVTFDDIVASVTRRPAAVDG
jgi:hypothetical protein